MTNFMNAVSAYRNAANPLAGLEKKNEASSGESSTEVGTDFASVLKDAAKVSVGAAKTAEKASLAAVAGKADIREVVAAVANAEMTLDTVVNVRDKVITAYNEILRMPI
ncbi:flagellar hook-basal body protein FliE [Paramagnetospirillum marisnigri]|uniref:Flagellar hook-basal body complex protein FliE n=1 Tax=Paramagnetospirillum marisnigri TaxID=1285242 RepID=A0A178MNQ7_9PROT|nr:flagellar hook-basal body complex protein FliE [Paramagnetospirillum marisnigri]OAN50231.1 flagellar hook-basal body protein FliE [Paramagnetospirillum marisnigri]